VRHDNGGSGAWSRELAWIALPFLAYLALLQALWFDVPIWDDYSVILDGTMRMMDAQSWREKMGVLLAQHNEHRVVVTRILAWLAAESNGDRIDFRVLVLAGNLSLAAILVLFWREFRGCVGAPAIAAAGFILCQLTFFEGALLSMAAISNLGVIAFAFACLYFALQPGRRNAAWALAFGLLAAASQANGLLALPLAAGACALQRRWWRAAVMAATATVLWGAYLAFFQAPPHHPPLSLVLEQPLVAAHLFVVITGGLAQAVGPATVLGIALLALLAWLTVKGFWRRHPVAALWIAFILLSALAAAVGRVGWGVFHASRYAINSSCLAAIALLLLFDGRDGARLSARYLLPAAALVSLALSLAAWRPASAYAFQARLLAKAVPSTPEARAEPYFGVTFLDTAYPVRVLERADSRGLYRAPQVRLFASAPAALEAIPQGVGTGGQVDTISVANRRVTASGWTDITADVPGRVFAASGPKPAAVTITATSRADLALQTRSLQRVFAGFRWEAEYESDDQARRAAESLCMLVQAPNHRAEMLASARCPASRP
jgi:hypothetical protein